MATVPVACAGAGGATDAVACSAASGTDWLSCGDAASQVALSLGMIFSAQMHRALLVDHGVTSVLTSDLLLHATHQSTCLALFWKLSLLRYLSLLFVAHGRLIGRVW